MGSITQQTEGTIEQQLENLKAYLVDGVISKQKYEFLERLMKKAESPYEAALISGLGTIYKKTGFHFERQVEKMSNTIQYLSKNEDLSFGSMTEIGRWGGGSL